MTTTTAPETRPAREQQPALQRQFVNFMFFRMDDAYRGAIETRRERSR